MGNRLNKLIMYGFLFFPVWVGATHLNGLHIVRTIIKFSPPFQSYLAGIAPGGCECAAKMLVGLVWF